MTREEEIQFSYRKTKSYLNTYIDKLQGFEATQSLLISFIRETENEELKALIEEIRKAEVTLQNKIRKNRKLILDIVEREINGN